MMFLNRELSWIEFNRRVLNEAKRIELPLLERLKFLAITASNFDEFFMVRVASLRRAMRSGNLPYGPTRERPSEQLEEILKRYVDFVSEQYTIHDEIIERLHDHGIRILNLNEVTQAQKQELKSFFENELFNVLAPVKVESKRPFPFTAGLRLNLAFLLQSLEQTTESSAKVDQAAIDSSTVSDEAKNEDLKLAILEIPSYLPRFYEINSFGKTRNFIRMEDLILLFSERLFEGYKILKHLSFRLTRDADIPVDEEKEEDFVEAMNKILMNRRHSHRVRLEINSPPQADDLIERLIQELEIDRRVVFHIPGPLSLRDYFWLATQDFSPELCFESWEPVLTIPDTQNLWDLIREKDVLIFPPYHSFSPVVRLLQEAANDPNVLSIRMTLYRTGGDSPIVQALVRAAENGKQVLVLVELKARFDEEQNLGWAQTLEKVGCIVIYGVANLKVHAKAMLIVRREEDGIRRYVHLGTGNYHVKTSRLYTDLGIFSSRNEYTYEVAQFFNSITGYSVVQLSHYIIMAPHHLKKKLLSLIEWQTNQAKAGIPSRIRAKMNALADEDIIKALYRAAEAGVKIELNVRGICMLNPGYVPNAHIHIISIIDRFLEHARIFFFESGERQEVFLASADWMYRNLERRVELMFSVIQEDHRQTILHILDVIFSDNVNSHLLNTKGEWERLHPQGQKPVRAQLVFHEEAEMWKKRQNEKRDEDLGVRRKS
jgi:polyphosphate kinase